MRPTILTTLLFSIWITPAALAEPYPGPLGEVSALMAPLAPSANDFGAKVDTLRRQLGKDPSADQLRLAIDQLSKDLGFGSDSPRLYTEEDAKYWVESACFGGDIKAAPIAHIGAWFARSGKRWFIHSLVPGGAAERAGFIRGDEIIDVDHQAFQPVLSFSKLMPGAEVTLRFRRLPWDAPKQVTLRPDRSSLVEALAKMLSQGGYLRRVGDKEIMYLPLPLSCHPSLAERLMSQAKVAQMRADALVLDLRGDYSDGGLTYLEPFVSVPTSAATLATPVSVAPYAKPLVVLVDHGTSGGREQLAAFLQKAKRAILVGEPTAAASRPGRAVALSSGREILWLPQPGVASDPLKPDILVTAPLIYAAGSDPQLDQAMAVAASSK